MIGKDRYIDVFVVRPDDRKAIAIECKYQDSLGTVDEKIPYALQDLEALWVPGCLVYAGKGWSKGVHAHARGLAARGVLPARTRRRWPAPSRRASSITCSRRSFGFWELVLPAAKRLKPAS